MASGCTPDSDEILIIRPHFCFCMCGTAARVARTADKTFKLYTSIHSSSVRSSNDPNRSAPPALFTSTWTVPNFFAASSIGRRAPSGVVTSDAIASTEPPVLRISAAVASSSLPFRLLITTCAPSSANASAIERPIPLLEPVTTTTLPFSPSSIYKLLLFLNRPTRFAEPSSAAPIRHRQLDTDAITGTAEAAHTVARERGVIASPPCPHPQAAWSAAWNSASPQNLRLPCGAGTEIVRPPRVPMLPESNASALYQMQYLPRRNHAARAPRFPLAAMPPAFRLQVPSRDSPFVPPASSRLGSTLRPN